MKHRLLAPFAIAALVGSAAPAFAHRGAKLPDRPIKRSEVVDAVKAQFEAMDTNHDDVVTEAEFEAYRAKQAASGGESDALTHVSGHWFEHADKNGTGRVTLAQAEVHPLKMFDRADVNHDGVVSLSERKMAMALRHVGG